MINIAISPWVKPHIDWTVSSPGGITFHVASHDVQISELLGKTWVQSDSQSQVSERAKGHQGDLWGRNVLLVRHQRAATHTHTHTHTQTHTQTDRQSPERVLTCFWFSVTSRIIALTACSFWIFCSQRGSVSLITSPSPSVPKWSLTALQAPTRGAPEPRNTGICRENKPEMSSVYRIILLQDIVEEQMPQKGFSF